MHDGVHAGDRGRQRPCVRDVASRLLEFEPGEEATAARSAKDQPDGVPFAGEPLGDVGAEEAAGTGDEDFHRGSEGLFIDAVGLVVSAADLGDQGVYEMVILERPGELRPFIAALAGLLVELIA